MESSFLSIMENSIKEHWELPALTDYQGATFQYKDIARKIFKLHILFEECGVQKGDKIALIGRNSSNWAIAFIATLSYGAVIVPILHEFKPDSLHHIVNHCEAKLLFVGDTTWENMVPSDMIRLSAIYSLSDFSILYCCSNQCNYARENLNKIFGERYPKAFTKADVRFHQNQANDLAVISYTSGTTSHSKGVMLPYRSLHSNLLFACEVIPSINENSNVVSLLPMAHMYGMSFEFLFEFAVGCHIFFLTRTPSPKIIFEAFSAIKPDLIIAVPLIVEKIYKKQIQPILDRPAIKALLKLPIIDSTITNQIKQKLVSAFGGKFYEVIIGGAPLNRETEDFFKRMQFPYTIGYGMTECGPIITYAPWDSHKLHSCGKAAPRMEITIDSPDPENKVGEILVKGDNVMLGYYKNEAATQAVFTKDGWLKTGDLGTIDAEGNLFIKGRSKTMILGSNGQNIYPEEIEDALNTMPLVAESLVLDMGEGKLEACVYPDFESADRDNITITDIRKIMEQNRAELNASLPSYSQLNRIRIISEEFEKTPKRSIKRFLYQITKD
ncbi:MAG: AMP-binding protein [Bacteroidales bacterium]